MAQNSASADGGSTIDHPAADLDTIVVDPDDVVASIRRNRRDETKQRSHVLRVTPPLQGERTASLHVSEPHTHYPPEMDPTPLHISPEAFIVGHGSGSRHPEFRGEWEVPDRTVERSRFRDHVDAYDDAGNPLPVEGELADAWDEWWSASEEHWEDRVRTALAKTETLTLASRHPDVENTTVSVRFEGNGE